ncbi:peptide deformylase [Arboricoccus pini]|uniref:Peptide deformylase n=1 Tax=Arboricoccus pini TaxID=1963835 RepID=A0A212RZY2_9PROT|nr:peptide deformylase [Arboricoccus pini]SNB78248.1 peptide deformylase [Arboricoccus pini]
MSIRELTLMGNPVLLEVAQPITDLDDPELQILIDDMVATMEEAAGIGIAAPQVGQSRRLIVALPIQDRNEEREPPMILLNPVLEPLDDEMVDGLEGCLSIPGLRGIVPRHRRVRYRALDRTGEPIEGIAEDLFARILQHEVDHLDGILFTMRMTDLRLLAMQSEAHYLARSEADSEAPEDDEEEAGPSA